MLLKGLEEVAERAQPGSRGRDGADPPGLYRRPVPRPTMPIARALPQAAARRRPKGDGCASRLACSIRADIRAIDEPGRAGRRKRPRQTADEGLTSQVRTAEGVPMLRTFTDVVDDAGTRREAQAEGAPGRARQPGAVRSRRRHRAAVCCPAHRKELPTSCARSSMPGPAGAGWWPSSKAPGERPLGEVAREREAAEAAREIEQHPAVAAILQEFPDAAITSVRTAAGHQERRNRDWREVRDGCLAECPVDGFPVQRQIGNPRTLHPQPNLPGSSSAEERHDRPMKMMKQAQEMQGRMQTDAGGPGRL